MTFATGSEWRKWDLHVHMPGTKLSNGYSGENALDEFCKIIEGSDVEVIGIADYFSVAGFYEFTDRFYELYPESSKVFMPNIELRLNESVNSATEEVNIHIILPQDIEKKKAIEFISKLATEATDGNGRNMTCADLSREAEYKAATVTRDSLKSAIESVFGKNERQNNLLVVTAANNDGLRAARGSRRKANITDQIDKFSDGYFGSSKNTEWFLKTDRLEDTTQTIPAKPVFSGSDAHSFEDLKNWLGKSVSSESASKEVTWIKANPTFAGLQQTLIEPDERVKIQDLKPDDKEPYKLIKRVTFSGTSDFPDEIVFNGNLSSIIGSRSSGKSALLAYIAHAIDPEDTIKRQMAAQEETDRNKIGPAAGKTWASVSSINCTVEWATGDSEGGKVIYIPQNYLYSISKRPEEINSRIEPVLFARYSGTEDAYNKADIAITTANDSIRSATRKWFDSEVEIQKLRRELADLGDKKAVQAAKDAYHSQIEVLKKSLSLEQEEIELYRSITEQIGTLETRQASILAEKSTFNNFYDTSNEESPAIVNVKSEVSFHPSLDGLPTRLVESIHPITQSAEEGIDNEVKKKLLEYRVALDEEEVALKAQVIQIKSDNKALIEKNQKNAELTSLIDKFNHQSGVLTSISQKEELVNAQVAVKKQCVEQINGALISRAHSQLDLSQVFSQLEDATEMKFGIEIGVSSESVEELSERYNRREVSPYLGEGGRVDIEKIRTEVGSYLEHLLATQKLKVNQDKKLVAIDTLCLSEEIRFTASLEGDKIGGFSLSTMTPGKQALFALTLILDESGDAWPLLIDQPEDDLDSRSIYEYIVPYVMNRKKERQILMVSHNANLVVGADSEQIIVANRNGVDRKNRDKLTFDYLTGAIEDSRPKSTSKYVLDTCGIREHSIDILDGGKEAFEKRKHKYKI